MNNQDETFGNKLLKILCAPFIIPASIPIFISGVWLSTAVNIATSPIPAEPLASLEASHLAAMTLFFVASISFMAWGVFVNHLHAIFESVRKSHPTLSGWRDTLLKSTEEDEETVEGTVCTNGHRRSYRKAGFLWTNLFISVATMIAGLCFLI
jgi:hypothetical protein